MILAYRWETFRDNWLRIAKRRPVLTICVAAVPVIIILFLIVTLPTMKQSAIPEVINKEWYYDLNTGDLFASKSGQTPPIEAPSGPHEDGMLAGVRAYVFYKNGDEKNMIIGFLEKEQTVETNHSDDANVPVSLKLIKKVDGAEWVPANSEQGRAIAREYFSGKSYTKCQP